MRALLPLAFVGGLTMAPPIAHADELSRLDDRWFFSLYGGTSRTSAGSLTLHNLEPNYDQRTIDDDPPSGSGTAGGFDVSFWPNDWIGFGFGGEYAGIALRPTGYDRCEGTSCSATPELPGPVRYRGYAMQVGAAVRVGIPLRYIHPYIGLGPGLTFLSIRAHEPERTHNSYGEPRSVYGGNLGSRFGLRTFAGVNGYVTRDFRIFAEYHIFSDPKNSAMLLNSKFRSSSGSASERTGDQKLVFRDLRVDYAVLGIAWSPRIVRKLSPRRRWQVVGGIAATTVFMTGAVALAQSN